MARLPPHFLKCVVAVGERQSEESVNWIATGWFLGTKVGVGTLYRTYLVTNRHVADELRDGVVRLNSPGNSPAREFSLFAPGQERSWIVPTDPEVDIAAVPVGVKFGDPSNSEIGCILSDSHCLTSEQMRASEIQEGDGAFLLGFPMGLVGATRDAPIVRSAMIARVRDLHDGASKEFLVDSLVFPGNSGGFVASCPEFASIEGTPPTTASHVLGVVAAYLPYSDVAISQQTSQPRVIFEENSGLAVVYPLDPIFDAITQWESANPANVPREPIISEVES